ncbi:MAG TPA: outer membrane protein assembly factor BamA, partial [Candidatus Omnitrophota bacterium]|nr:outer membrane protein assembly factor BamA [Candidatus Omnitrophota bacterium]
MKRNALLLIALFAGSLFLSLPVSVSAEESGPTVKAIDVRGNKTVSSLAILAKVKTQIGQPLSSTILNEDLKRLYGLGYFTDVRIEQEDYEDGIKVVFLVVEKPVLAEIKVEGNNKLKKDEIKKVMTSVVGDFVDQKRVRDDVEAVRALYEKKGFSDVQIDSALDVNPDTSQAALRVIINEGSKVRIREIKIIGNDNVKSGDIHKAMKTKTMSWWGWFRPGFLNEMELNEDLERIKALYDEHGFSDVEVSTETAPLGETGDVVLNVMIKEGKKYLVGAVTFKGNDVIKTEELQKTIQMGEEDPFSRRHLRLDVSAIQDLYFENGYLSAQIRSESIYDDKTDRVNVTYSINEKELNYVDRVIIQGNSKTKDIVIRRELRAYPGESFSGAKLKRSKERLYNLGFFEDVRFDTEPGSAPNSKDLIVSVKEQKTGEFSFGGGYSSIDSVLGFVQIRQRNFDWRNYPEFVGAGQDFSVRIEAGSVRKNAELSFTEPWVFGHPYSFGFDIYMRDYDRSGSAGYFYNQEKIGLALRLGKEFNDFDRGLLVYRIEEVDISDIPDDASEDLKSEEGTNMTSSLAYTLTRDMRDNRVNPTKGYLLSGTAEYAGGFLAGDKDFYKLSGTASTYFKNFDKNVLELKARAGIAEEHGDSDEVP